MKPRSELLSSETGVFSVSDTTLSAESVSDLPDLPDTVSEVILQADSERVNRITKRLQASEDFDLIVHAFMKAAYLNQ